MLDSQHWSRPNTTRELLTYRSHPQLSQPADLRITPRKPTPSPLQISPMTADTQHSWDGEGNSHSSTASQAERECPPAPHSPPSSGAAIHDQPKSPSHRLDELLATETVLAGEASKTFTPSVQSAVERPQNGSTDRQLRSVSSPLVPSTPRSPPSTASSRFTNTAIQASPKSFLRTSSIDSTSSTMSATTGHSYKPAQGSSVQDPDYITHLISTFGSPEAVIKDLQRKNAKAWELLDRQTATLRCLHNELKKAVHDKERYKKKLKEYLAQLPSTPNQADCGVTSRTSTPDDAIVGQDGPGDETAGNTALTAEMARMTSIEGSASTPKLEGDRSVETLATIAETATPSSVAMRLAIDTDASQKPSSTVDDLNSKKHNGSEGAATPAATELNRPDQPRKDTKPVVSPTGFMAKRLQPHLQNSIPLLSPEINASSPQGSSQEGYFPPRKLAPAPLDLSSSGREATPKHGYGASDHSDSEYDEDTHVEEIIATFERGRKKTRAEDDREREALVMREQQDRSRSKKEKGSKSSSQTKAKDLDHLVQSPMASVPSNVRAFAPHPTPGTANNFLAAPNSLAGVLAPAHAKTNASLHNSVLAAQPLSPGLPMSPRPVDRPMNSPMPRMPRDGTGKPMASPLLPPRTGLIGLPLSPRAPKQFTPFSSNPPVSIAFPASGHAQAAGQSADPPGSENALDSRSLAARLSASSNVNGVYAGFISEAYPNLLLPPNALPSIVIKVISSRLRPSRSSYLASKASEEELVFTLGVLARSDLQGLWQLEKTPASVSQLDQQLKQTSALKGKLPDRGLFNGQAPAKVDARRVALERYFESLLDSPMDNRAALALCYYLSTQVVETSGDEVNGKGSTPGSPTNLGPDGRILKEGYLTKRGKNFGGWKARFFVLDDPVLRYYESPGGSLLGTIKLFKAKIEKPQHNSSGSPSRGSDNHDNQYRHAFFLLEPKRKDLNSHVRHTLCAESDVERDAWVEALLWYVDGYPQGMSSAKPSLSSSDSSPTKAAVSAKRPSVGKESSLGYSPESDTFDSLQSVSYESTAAAQPSTVHVMPEQFLSDSPSPPDTGIHPAVGSSKSYATKNISGPSNGVKIEDAEAWGNKPIGSWQSKDMPKKRSIWGFRDRHPSDALTTHSNDSTVSLSQLQNSERTLNMKPVFGMELAQAVELCPPKGSQVCLPAVVYRCIEYLEAKDAWNEVGIFRQSGSSLVIDLLRERFDTEGDFDILADEEFNDVHAVDVHAVASLLKRYLGKLPARVLPQELQEDINQVLSEKTMEWAEKIAGIQAIVQRLPKPNWTLLRAMCECLINVVDNSDVNKMTISNINIILSPTLSITPTIISLFSTDFDAIFDKDYKDVPAPAFETSITKPLMSDDIRSPRHQIISDIPTPSYHQFTFPKYETSYDQMFRASRPEHNVSFIPPRPSYEPPTPGFPPYDQPQQPSLLSGSDYGVMSRKSSASTIVKSRRHESSMALMGSDRKKASNHALEGDSGMFKTCAP